MYRLTTPQHRFNLPLETERIADLIVSYGQGRTEVLNKRKDNCALEGNTVIVKLTQQETKLFKPDVPVKIQIRLLTVDGEALASCEYLVKCKDVLNDEVLI